MKNTRLLSLLSLTLLLTTVTNAVTIGFDTTADYDNNFVELTASGASTLGTFTVSGAPVLRKLGAGAQSAIFDTGATGGSAGSGGTSGTGTNLFGDVSVSADVRFATLNGPSIGLFSRVNESYTSGYLALFGTNTAGEVRLRIYDSNANPSSTGVGTNLYDQTFIPGTAISDSAFYTVSFSTVTTVTNTVLLTVNFSTTAGTSIASASFEDTTSPLLAFGQVGLRAASQTLYIDNFTVTAIPEPSAYATVLGLGALGLIVCQRRRARS